MKSVQRPGRHPLTSFNAYAVIVSAFRKGFVYPTAHFQKRMGQRKFTSVHARQAIMQGSLYGDAVDCPEFKNWKYRIRGHAEGKVLEVVLGLDMEKDLVIEPSIVLITAFWIVSRKSKLDIGEERKT